MCEPCNVVDQHCIAPANLEIAIQARCVCFSCDMPVCSECSSIRKYMYYGKQRLCNDCQIDMDGTEWNIFIRICRNGWYSKRTKYIAEKWNGCLGTNEVFRNRVSMLTFYDPHPGLAGCPVPLPDHMKTAVDWLNGQSITIDEAVDIFTNAVNDSGLENAQLSCHNDCIILIVGKWSDPPVHSWRLIRFREKS